MKERYLYQNYEGKLYEKLGIAYHSETGEKMIVCRQCRTESLEVVPFSIFNGFVETDKGSIDRFKFLGRF